MRKAYPAPLRLEECPLPLSLHWVHSTPPYLVSFRVKVTSMVEFLEDHVESTKIQIDKKQWRDPSFAAFLRAQSHGHRRRDQQDRALPKIHVRVEHGADGKA